ncbi:MAG TPA: hypothetical protein VEZ20_04795 [Allosphingosinicella sp.]|jgi:hypothetical protein|nr:hypothetical protein [Allosphingosinicella sp.]
MNWCLAALAAGAFAFALLASSVAPASECSTPHSVHWHIAALPFLLFVAAGGYVFFWGGAAVRLLLFAWMCLVLAGYVAGLGLSLPIVYETEISCARQGMR